MERMVVFIDGVVLHNRTLKVEVPDRPGAFMTADVRDPIFDQAPNIYTSAIGSSLEVEAKAVRRADGELAKLYILNAGPLTARAA